MSFLDRIFSSKAKPEPQKASPIRDYSRILTSQLAALWLDAGEERFRREYLRRLALCGLQESTARDMLQFETDMLKAHPRPEMLREDFIVLPCFSLRETALDQPVAYYRDHLEYPLSYVVKLSDEAEWHFWNSHERDLPDGVWAEIFALSDRNRRLFLPLATHLVEKRGWTVDAVNKFSFNEQGMLDRYRWNRRTTAAARNPWPEQK